MNLKKIAKAVLPGSMLALAEHVRTEVAFVREFSQDRQLYRKSSGHKDSSFHCNLSSGNLEAQITKDYHRIEKGLALSAPKRPFGAEVERRLRKLIPIAQQASWHSSYVEYAEDALTALAAWNADGRVLDLVSPVQERPTKALDPLVAQEFFTSRRSVRHFDPSAPPTTEVLAQAARLAASTPSVCNRQAARVHYFTSPADVTRVLSHQNGNAGFRENVPAVAVVTVDRRLFTGVGERNQRWIDGGLFAMTLVWSLHALGLQTCMLNWSMTNAESESLRADAEISGNEDIVVLIAIGKAAQGHRYARSARRPLSEMLFFH